MTYYIRELTNDDFDAAIALGSYAFKVQLSDEQREQQRQHFVIDGITRYGLFEGEQLCSQLLLHHYEFVVQGKAMKGSGVAFVSSWPEHRRNGYVAKLIQYSLKMMKEKGELVSALHPFSVAFYRKFGYELLSQRVKNSMPISYIKRIEIKGNIERETNYLELKDMYDEYSKRYNGMLARNESQWQHFVPNKKKGSVVIYRDANQNKRGYIIYHIAPQSMKMNILEFVALDKEAHQALWSFIGQHDSMIDNVEWFTPYEDTQCAELTDPRITREVEQYGMSRIVDCKSFIDAYQFLRSATNEQQQFYLHIEDNYADWNNRLFCLIIELDGKASLTEINKEEIIEQLTIMLSINTLSGLLIGYYSADHLIWNERIVGQDEVVAAWAKRVPKQETQLIDYF